MLSLSIRPELFRAARKTGRVRLLPGDYLFKLLLVVMTMIMTLTTTTTTKAFSSQAGWNGRMSRPPAPAPAAWTSLAPPELFAARKARTSVQLLSPLSETVLEPYLLQRDDSDIDDDDDEAMREEVWKGTAAIKAMTQKSNEKTKSSPEPCVRINNVNELDLSKDYQQDKASLPLSSDKHTTITMSGAESSEKPTSAADETEDEQKSTANANSKREEGQDETKEEEGSDSDDAPAVDVTRAAAWLASRSFRSTKPSSKREKSTGNDSTSVGPRRVKEATRVRNSGSSTTSKIMESLRRKSLINTSLPKEGKEEKPTPDNQKPPSAADFQATTKRPRKLSLGQSVIHQAIDDLLRSRGPASPIPPSSDHPLHSSSRSMGILGDAGPTTTSSETDERVGPQLLEKPAWAAPLHPGEVIIPASAAADAVMVRRATSGDDVDVANLRLSVFTSFEVDLHRQLCARSCRVMASRRLQGATCLVALGPSNANDQGNVTDGEANDGLAVCGSVECSFHEFAGTRLGRRRKPRAVWYVTEVVVHPSMRRKGIAQQLLHGVDILARKCNVETLYLHVDVKNAAAIALYRKAGYQCISTPAHHHRHRRQMQLAQQRQQPLPLRSKRQQHGQENDYNMQSDKDAMFLEFTTSLNLHPGATQGRDHYLFYKNLVAEPVWLPADDEEEHSAEDQRQPLGFEIPA